MRENIEGCKKPDSHFHRNMNLCLWISERNSSCWYFELFFMNPSSQGVRLDSMTSGIEGDVNSTRLSPAAQMYYEYDTARFTLNFLFGILIYGNTCQLPRDMENPHKGEIYAVRRTTC